MSISSYCQAVRVSRAKLLFWAAVAVLTWQADWALGQAVQLPTIQVFSVDTTVSVPDGGGIVLGGVSRAADGSASRGLPLAGRLGGNRALGSERGHAGMSLHATIIDNHELDQAVLAEAAALRGGKPVETGLARSLPEPAPVASSSAARTVGVSSLAALRAQNAAADEAQQEEARAYLAKAEAAAAAGKTAVARSFYLLAHRRATGDLAKQVQSRLAALQQPVPRSLAVGK